MAAVNILLYCDLVFDKIKEDKVSWYQVACQIKITLRQAHGSKSFSQTDVDWKVVTLLFSVFATLLTFNHDHMFIKVKIIQVYKRFTSAVYYTTLSSNNFV